MSDGDFQTEGWVSPPKKVEIIDLVKNKVVKFDSYRQGNFYYNIYDPNKTPDGECYQFIVPIDDIGTATLLATDKALTFMRQIRKANENGTLIKL